MPIEYTPPQHSSTITNTNMENMRGGANTSDIYDRVLKLSMIKRYMNKVQLP